MINRIKQQLSNKIDRPLVDALLQAYSELKNQYYLGKHKPSELEGGHFAEVVIRILQHIAEGKYTPLDTSLVRFDIKEVEKYSQLPRADFHDSVRIHIPRAILSIYGIRNRRGVGHIGGDVNPNLPDSTFIVATCDWILTELISLYYTSSREEAQILVDSLVEKKVPLVQDFDGFLKVLAPNISIADKALVLLYSKGVEGAFFNELLEWIKTRPSYLNKVLQKLDDEANIHYTGGRCLITRVGEAYVETNILFHLDFSSVSAHSLIAKPSAPLLK